MEQEEGGHSATLLGWLHGTLPAAVGVALPLVLVPAREALVEEGLGPLAPTLRQQGLLTLARVGGVVASTVALTVLQATEGLA